MNNPSLLIPDASVLLKWVLPAEGESCVEQAISMRDAFVAGEITLMVPDLWYYEVGNTLSRKYPDEAEDLLSGLLAMGFDTTTPNHRWQAAILQLVSAHRVTFYDAAYHALAVISGGVFVTADEKYLASADAARHIVHLQEWSSAQTG
jgi:predicted nucleic acid-binding protein